MVAGRRKKLSNLGVCLLLGLGRVLNQVIQFLIFSSLSWRSSTTIQRVTLTSPNGSRSQNCQKTPRISLHLFVVVFPGALYITIRMHDVQDPNHCLKSWRIPSLHIGWDLSTLVSASHQASDPWGEKRPSFIPKKTSGWETHSTHGTLGLCLSLFVVKDV